MIGMGHDEAVMMGGTTISAKAVGTVLFTKYIMLVEIAALLLLAALVAAYHLGKESIDEEIVGHASQDVQPSVGSIKQYDNDSALTQHDGVKMANPYEYKDVDPHDYVGMKVGMKTGANKVTRKEAD